MRPITFARFRELVLSKGKAFAVDSQSRRIAADILRSLSANHVDQNKLLERAKAVAKDSINVDDPAKSFKAGTASQELYLHFYYFLHRYQPLTVGLDRLDNATIGGSFLKVFNITIKQAKNDEDRTSNREEMHNLQNTQEESSRFIEFDWQPTAWENLLSKKAFREKITVYSGAKLLSLGISRPSRGFPVEEAIIELEQEFRFEIDTAIEEDRYVYLVEGYQGNWYLMPYGETNLIVGKEMPKLRVPRFNLTSEPSYWVEDTDKGIHRYVAIISNKALNAFSNEQSGPVAENALLDLTSKIEQGELLTEIHTTCVYIC